MKRVEGSAGVALIECTSPVRNKWRIRWDIQKNGDGLVSYMEEEFDSKPTPENIEKSLFENDMDISKSELVKISELLGYNWSEFEMRFNDGYNTRLGANPYMQLMEVVREQHLTTTDISDVVALRVPATFFSFAELCKRGKQVAKGVVFRYGGKTWRVVQAHTPVDIYPPSFETAALYVKIESKHAGTIDDPIPYEQGMAFEQGKYYSQYGVVYICILTTETGYPNDLKDLPTIVTPV